MIYPYLCHSVYYRYSQFKTFCTEVFINIWMLTSIEIHMKGSLFTEIFPTESKQKVMP